MFFNPHLAKSRLRSAGSWFTGDVTPGNASRIAFEANADKFANSVGGVFTQVAKGALKVAAVPAMLALGAGILATDTTITIGSGIVSRGLNAMLGANAGVLGVGAAGIHMATHMANAVGRGAMVGERLFRGFATGSPMNRLRGGRFMERNPVDAYFPQAKKSWDEVGLAKWAPAPSIIRRMAGASAVYSVAKAMGGELFSSGAPAPSIFMDESGNIRHKNDWGSNANLGRSVMGSQSDFNLNKDTMLKLAMYT